MPPAQRVSVRINEVFPDRRPLLAGRESHVRRGQYQGHDDEDPQEQGTERTKDARMNCPDLQAARSARQICPSAVLQAAAKQCPATEIPEGVRAIVRTRTIIRPKVLDRRRAGRPPAQPKEGGRASPSTSPSELATRENRDRGGGKRTRVQACDV